ncbi:hypothetical protein J3A83DRAFT_4307418 [Scleroderma citrinum]
MEPQLEVNYKEMVKLARMEKQEQKQVRECLGYKKIFSSCEQTKRDGYDWLWVDTCCIDTSLKLKVPQHRPPDACETLEFRLKHFFPYQIL